MILLVDMGSLEGIAEHLDCPMEVGVINNISTGLALDIGMRLSRCEPLETDVYKRQLLIILKTEIRLKLKADFSFFIFRRS